LRKRLIWLTMAAAAVTPVFGSTIINLGTASSFGLLGGTISNTGTSGTAPFASNVVGDVGATVTITGFPPGTATGTTFTSPNGPSTVVGTAYSDFESALSAAELLPSTGVFTTATSQTFLGNTVYASSSDITTATGTSLTFDAQGDPTALFIIRVNGAFTVNGVMTFTLDGLAQADNIFWIVGNNATISVGSAGPIAFDGNILAGDTFTMSAASGGSGVLAGTINGCVFARNANTLAGTTNVGGCSSASESSVPEPETLSLLSMGLGAGCLLLRKFRSTL